jgi:hypothetical protein
MSGYGIGRSHLCTNHASLISKLIKFTICWCQSVWVWLGLRPFFVKFKISNSPNIKLPQADPPACVTAPRWKGLIKKYHAKLQANQTQSRGTQGQVKAKLCVPTPLTIDLCMLAFCSCDDLYAYIFFLSSTWFVESFILKLQFQSFGYQLALWFTSGEVHKYLDPHHHDCKFNEAWM